MATAPEIYGRPPWKIRRRIVNLTLLFCAGAVAWLLGQGEDNELNRAIATGAFLLAGSTIASYVFGAAWDDRNVMTTLGPKAYQDQVLALPPPDQTDWPADIHRDEEPAPMDAGTMRDAP